MLGKNRMSTWSNGSRPASPRKGVFGLNVQTDAIEIWDGSAWVEFSDDTAYEMAPRLKNIETYSLPGWVIPSTTTKTFNTSTGDTLFIPIAVSSATTFDRIAVNVTSAGHADNPIRLGIYESKTVDGYLLPGDVAVDGGLVAVDGTGEKYATINTTLQAGYYFVVISITTGSITNLILTSAVTTTAKPPIQALAGTVNGNMSSILYLIQGVTHQSLYDDGYTDDPTVGSTSLRDISGVVVRLRSSSS